MFQFLLNEKRTFSSQTPNKTARAQKEKVQMIRFYHLKSVHVLRRKATPEISCRFQATWDASPPATAWENQAITDKFGCFRGVNLSYLPSSGPPWSQQLSGLGGYCLWCPILQDFCMDVAFPAASLPGAGWCPEPTGSTCTSKAREILAVAFYWAILGRTWCSRGSRRVLGILVASHAGWCVGKKLGWCFCGGHSFFSKGCTSKSQGSPFRGCKK